MKKKQDTKIFTLKKLPRHLAKANMEHNSTFIVYAIITTWFFENTPHLKQFSQPRMMEMCSVRAFNGDGNFSHRQMEFYNNTDFIFNKRLVKHQFGL